MATPLIEALAEDEQAQPFDSSDPKQVNEARKRSGRRKKSRLEYLRRIMESEAGRQWMHGLLVACDTFRTPLERADPQGTAFRAGKQYVGLQLWADVTSAAVDLYPLMIQEAKRRHDPTLHPSEGLST